MINQNQLIHLLLAFALPVILLVTVFLYTHNSPQIAHAADTITITGTADDGTVSNLDGNGTCDLREAIGAANINSTVGECIHDGSSGTDTINFAIPGAGAQTIMLSSTLAITDTVVISGTTQTGADCSSWPPTLQIILDGSRASGSNALQITGGSSTIDGLVINQFSGFAIQLMSNNNNITCNFIGTDVNGTAALGNTNGVQLIFASGNQIGGTTSRARNLISGNGIHGLYILGIGATGNVIEGNYIGTDVNGTSDLGNGNHGIFILGASSNRIGGTTTGAGNIISGNDENGLHISTMASNMTVQGNYIGTDVNGTADLGNTLDGITVSGASNNTIGGASAAARNIISGNEGDGVALLSSSTGNRIQGNYIGTDVNGTTDLGNTSEGVTIQSGSNNNIVGTNGDGTDDTAEGNLISGNDSHGILVNGSNSNNNIIAGNQIGTNPAGTAAMANTGNGVQITNGAQSNRIGTDGNGTSDTDERNLISGNSQNGVLITGSSASSNRIAGNYIGTQTDGSSVLGNGSNGVLITDFASNNTIGGLSANTGNIIAHNTSAGVAVESGTGNAIDPNSIFGNGGLGIDLGTTGATSNDADDDDTGANNLQNSPAMTSASIDGSDRLVIEYSVDSTSANSTYPLRIEFFEADAGGEGQTFIGSDSYTIAQASQTVTFTNASALGVSVDDSLVATATDAVSNTSEFSAVVIPLVVQLATFEAAPQRADILVRWQTTLELDNLGFNIWRGNDANTPQEQLNLALIPSASPGSGTGARYEWLDETVEAGETYYYWLEEVDIEDNLTRHGPISTTASIPTAVTLNQVTAISGRWPAFLWAMLLIGAVLGLGLVRRRV